MASTKKLVLIETDSTNTERGKLFALDPKDATGIALPSIRMVSALPSKGLVKGETVALEPDMSLYTWRGNTWTRLMGQGSSNCPVGAITTWPTTTPPAGWLLCDGAQFDRNAFPELFAILGKDTTPNLSDFFVRGARNAQDVGVESPWSTAFKAAMKAHAGGRHDHGSNTGDAQFSRLNTSLAGRHKHGTGVYLKDVSSSWGGPGEIWTDHSGNSRGDNKDTSEIADHRHTVDIPDHHHSIAVEPDHEHTLEGGDAETAPKNVRLWYIICATSTAAVASVTHTFLQSPVANAAALPANGNTNGDVRITLDDSHMHIWHGTPAASQNLPATNAAGTWSITLPAINTDQQVRLVFTLQTAGGLTHQQTLTATLTADQAAAQLCTDVAAAHAEITANPNGAVAEFMGAGTDVITNLVATITDTTAATGQWNDIGPTNGLTIPSTAGITDDRDLVFNHTTGQLEWRALVHELPVPSQATALYLPRINAAGTAYEVVEGLLWLPPVASAAALPTTNVELGQAAITLNNGHVYVWSPGHAVPTPGQLASIVSAQGQGGVWTITFTVEGGGALAAGVHFQTQFSYDAPGNPGQGVSVGANGSAGQTADQMATNFGNMLQAVNLAGVVTTSVAGSVVTLTPVAGHTITSIGQFVLTGAGGYDPTQPGWHDVTDLTGLMRYGDLHNVTQPIPADLVGASAGTVVLNVAPTAGQPHASWQVPTGPAIEPGSLLVCIGGGMWMPVGGSGGSGGVVLVADETERLALTPTDGTLVVQQDTGWTWRYQAAFVGNAFWSPWRVFSDYVGAPTIADRNALEPHIHIGTLVSVGNAMYQYVVNPNAGQPGQNPGVFVDFGQTLNPPGLEGIIIPAGAPAQGGTIKWSDFDATRLAQIPSGSYYIVSDTVTTVPAGVPNIAGNAVKPGDYVIALDTDGDTVSDELHLIGMPDVTPHWDTAAGMGNAIKFWRGTDAEYQAITAPDPDTLYYITP